MEEAVFQYRHISQGAPTILLVAVALVAFTGEKSAQAQVPDCDGAPACILIFK
jgi:hypothetical protein